MIELQVKIEKILKNFRDKEVKIIFNYGVLSRFDAPGTDAILIARPTTPQ